MKKSLFVLLFTLCLVACTSPAKQTVATVPYNITPVNQIKITRKFVSEKYIQRRVKQVLRVSFSAEEMAQLYRKTNELIGEAYNYRLDYIQMSCYANNYINYIEKEMNKIKPKHEHFEAVNKILANIFMERFEKRVIEFCLDYDDGVRRTNETIYYK